MSEKVAKGIRRQQREQEISSHVIGAHNIDEVIGRITKRPVDPLFIVIDLFCGAGGTSTGFKMAGDLALVIACVNHDFKAIKSHWRNYPDVAHFEEDIRKLDLRWLVRLVQFYRQLYPSALLILWASLECTNFSKAKGGQHSSIELPAPTITTKARASIISPEFLTIYNGKSLHRSVDEPSPVIACNDRLSLIQPEYFIDKHFGSSSQNQSIDQPSGTILPTDKHRLVQCESLQKIVRVDCNCGNTFISTEMVYEKVPCPKCGDFSGCVTYADHFIMPTNYDNQPKSIDEPLATITANRKHHYLVNPSWGGNPGDIDQPCCVIVARQDKAPLYFVQVESGPVAVAIYEGDSPCMIKIKQFMAIYGLVDIKMRMLRVHELLKIQGFPEGYKLEGNQADQKKFIGNSVVPHVVKAWTIALANRIIDDTKTKVA